MTKELILLRDAFLIKDKKPYTRLAFFNTNKAVVSDAWNYLEHNNAPIQFSGFFTVLGRLIKFVDTDIVDCTTFPNGTKTYGIMNNVLASGHLNYWWQR